MKQKNMNIVFSSSLIDIVEQNQSFDLGKLRIAYTGRNRNNSYISKDSFEKAIPTMFNCPVVANYIREEDEIGSHDGEFIKDEDGKVKYVNLTEPVGLIPESAEWYWETIEEEDGTLRQYLVADVVLWKRQEAYQKIKDNGVTKQSMEIEVVNGKMLDDYYEINDFYFTAFCLLGNAEPCFESASLITFEKNNDFKEQYTEMLKEFKLAFSNTDNNIAIKEGKKELKLKELLEKYSVSEDEINFEIEGLSDEELEAKFVEEFEKSDNDNFALNSELITNMRNALSEIKVETNWGEYERYWLVDYDAEAREVYFRDTDDGLLYGCPFVLNGDKVELDIDNITRKKYLIVDYIDGSENQTFEVNIKEILDTFSETYAECMDKINSFDSEEFERLKNYEKTILAEKRAAEEKALFKKFDEHMNENDEYAEIKKNASEYSISDLEKELFALLGRTSLSNYTSNNKPFVNIHEHVNENSNSMQSLFAWKTENND